MPSYDKDLLFKLYAKYGHREWDKIHKEYNDRHPGDLNKDGVRIPWTKAKLLNIKKNSVQQKTWKLSTPPETETAVAGISGHGIQSNEIGENPELLTSTDLNSNQNSQTQSTVQQSLKTQNAPQDGGLFEEQARNDLNPNDDNIGENQNVQGDVNMENLHG